MLLATLSLCLLGWVWTRIGVYRAEQRFPARGQLLSVECAGGASVRLRYTEAGSGPPIVLLHGAFGGLEDYEATLMPRLARTHRVLAFDRPGHGWSERVPGVENDPAVQADATHAALRRLGLQRVALLGFSYGGSVALTLALRHPELVSELILINTPSYPWDTGVSRAYSLAQVPILGAAFRHSLAIPLATLLAPSSVRNAFAPAEPVEQFERSPAALALTPERFLANAQDLVLLDAFLGRQTEQYRQLQPRTLLLAAPEDRVVGYHIHSVPLQESAPQAELVSIVGAGHALLFSHPDRLADEILRFLNAR